MAVVCLSLISASALASEGPFFGFSPGLVQGEAGRTSISIELGKGGFAGTIARGISGRADLAATVGEEEFDLEGRLLAFDLSPVGVLFTASFRGFAALMRLSLGPVRLDIARSWRGEKGRRLTVSVFPVEQLFFLAGWEERDGGSSPFLAFRVNPGRNALFGICVLISGDSLAVEVGGAF